MPKKIKKVVSEFNEMELIESLYKAAGGRRSHFIFLRDTEEDVIKQLMHKNLILKVKNNNKTPMFTITENLINQYKTTYGSKN